jgi:hypothetical protein
VDNVIFHAAEVAEFRELIANRDRVHRVASAADRRPSTDPRDSAE